MNMVLRFVRRQLHTRDIIKPSSPTPTHLKTYNLSLLDQCAPNAYIPIIVFYPSSDIYQSSHDKTLDMKNSLSQTLTQYYPFAGRLNKYVPAYVDCNDHGVEFIEACNDNSLSDFLQHSQHDDFDHLIPKDRIWFDTNLRDDNDADSVTCPLNVQVNHFACGGMAVATSLSHKVGDGRCAFNFINDWAKVTARSRSRDQKEASPINPIVIQYQARNTNFTELFRCRTRIGCVTRSFVFPNKKLNDLKAKVTTMTYESDQPIINPTRVEVLTWLLHKCAVSATSKNNSGNFKASGMAFPVDLRNIYVEKLPETATGNIVRMIIIWTSNQSELAPNNSIHELREKKTQLKSMRNMESINDYVVGISFETALEMSRRVAESYIYSSLCRFPAYGIDFGWGKPVKITFGGVMQNFTLLLDTPNDDGIEAIVCLDKEDMKTFQNDPDLLAFC